jgi:myo-inositol 2-dehydrogenase/D-chiro-inositol 1-dehydrogenase
MIDPAVSGGVAVDLMVHDFDQVAAILGTPRTVYARAVVAGPHGAPQHVVATVACEGGCASVEGGLLLPSSYPFTSGIRVLGSEGILEYSFSATPAADGGNIGGVDQDANALTRYPAAGEPERAAVESGDPWARQVTSLVNCIESGTEPERATGEQALLALRTALAANRSIASGHTEAV